MRVLRDIDPALLAAVRAVAKPFSTRRWERHDGSIIAEGDEEVLTEGDTDLTPLGLRRWKLQRVLYQYATDVFDIPVQFGLAVTHAEMLHDDLVRVELSDGTERYTRVLWGCDGGKSMVRNVVDAEQQTPLQYTGVTCLMGIAQDENLVTPGIAFPSSNLPDFHAVFFPTSDYEQMFQFHFPVEEHDADQLSWGNLSQTVGQEECQKLARELRRQGWHERYLQPLENVTNAVRVGFCLLECKLEKWVKDRMVLVGDAAHPPVPYLGQGAQQGMEDVNAAVALLKHYCYDEATRSVDLSGFDRAMKLYEKIRIHRSSHLLDLSKQVGSMNAARAGKTASEIRYEREMMLKGEVLLHGTMFDMFDGADHDYKIDTIGAIQNEERLSHETQRIKAEHGSKTQYLEDAPSPRTSIAMLENEDDKFFI